MTKDEAEPLVVAVRETMHPIYAVVFSLNYMMGSGFLTLPRAYVDAGISWGVALTIIIAFGAAVAAECLLEVMARAPRAMQIPELCTYFLGRTGNLVYMAMLCGFMIGSLWAYAAIFALSFGGPYRAYVVGFGFFVVPLACRDLSEQRRIQAALAVGRTLMLLLMTATAGIALISKGPAETTGNSTAGIVAASPIIAFACTMHHSVPQIVGPVDDTRWSLNWIFRLAFLGAAVIYLVFASTIALFFGDETQSAVNLDWASYRIMSSNVVVQALGSFLATFIVLYPAINVVSAFPLAAITLGDAFNDFYTRYLRDSKEQQPQGRKILACRLLAAVPPLIGALVASDISDITRFTGVFGLAMCGVYPGILLLAARRANPNLLTTSASSALNTPTAATLLVFIGSALCLTPLFSAAETTLEDHHDHGEIKR